MRRERKRNRLAGYDYSLPGWYYVTICIQDRIQYFGNVIDSQMVLNNNGQIVEKQWLWLGMQYDYVNIDEFVVMPNHLHGVLEIRDWLRGPPVGAGHDRPLRGRHGVKIKSLSELIGAFKTTSSKLIHQSGNVGFAWQRSFYDRIISNDAEYYRICEYIRDNPKNWDQDQNNSQTI